jgi:hypothetical protein
VLLLVTRERAVEVHTAILILQRRLHVNLPRSEDALPECLPALRRVAEHLVPIRLVLLAGRDEIALLGATAVCAEDDGARLGGDEARELVCDELLLGLVEQVEEGAGVDGGGVSAELVEAPDGGELGRGAGGSRCWGKGRADFEEAVVEDVSGDKGDGEVLGSRPEQFVAIGPESLKKEEGEYMHLKIRARGKAHLQTSLRQSRFAMGIRPRLPFCCRFRLMATVAQFR